ncbi:MAG: excinuclease ABC subunit UvrC [Oscillospiraceae bacterium]|nr:excinuclease ABC subunit UvrC [Oscillospiraceae bacterium]
MAGNLREKAARLPMKPGVYIMKDGRGEVIYVGKAARLKNRVSSYFVGSHNAKTAAMVSKISDFDVIIAASEFEALVLENSLIKRHMPKYNILLKDDKGYPFIRLDIKSEYPRFTVVSKKADDGAMYFGPFGGRSVSFSAIDAVSKALKLPTCSRKFPRDIGKERPCLNHHLGTCRAYCLKDASHGEYMQSIGEAVMIFEGRTDALIKKLSDDMRAAADGMRFELAAEIRDRIRAIEALKTRQRVLAQRLADTDIVGFYRGEAKSCFVVLHYIGGDLLGKDYELTDDPIESDAETVEALVRQYYCLESASVPRLICLPTEIDGAEALGRFLTEKAGRTVEFAVPQRGEKLKLVRSAAENAREEVLRATTGDERRTKTAQWLEKTLGLPKTPVRIEAFDISNTGASNIVAGMTVFSNGKPLKRDYRKFTIKSTETPDDYMSMVEAVSRRFERYLSGDEKFAELPDILLIDGGSAHANAAKRAIDKIGVSVPVFGMVKDDRHRTRALVTSSGAEIGIDAVPSVFAFIGRIQEETHRFAVEFHHAAHKKSAYASELTKIPGIGEKRRAELIRAFGSVKNIRTAEISDLERVLTKPAAAAVWNYYHGGESEGEGQ